MTDAATLPFDGTIPAMYDRCLGPLLFAPYADDVAQRVARQDQARAPVRTVVDVACGTGRVTRALAQALSTVELAASASSTPVRIIATDLSRSMVRWARSASPETPHVRWTVADACALPIAMRAADAVVCQFGVMFVPDPAAALREMVRVARPGASLVVSTWDSPRDNPWAQALHEVVTPHLPPGTPPFITVPFRMHDRAALRRLAETAGWDEVRVTAVSREAVGPSATDAAAGLVRGNPLVRQLEAQGVDVAMLEQQVVERLAQVGGRSPFRVPMQALLIEGHAPDGAGARSAARSAEGLTPA